MTAALATSILSLLAYLLPVLIEIGKEYREKQKGADHEANIQEYRKALGKGDSAVLAAYHADQHDRVRAALGGS